MHQTKKGNKAFSYLLLTHTAITNLPWCQVALAPCQECFFLSYMNCMSVYSIIEVFHPGA